MLALPGQPEGESNRRSNMKLMLRLTPVLLVLLTVGSPAVHVCRVVWGNRIDWPTRVYADPRNIPELSWPDLRGLDTRTGKSTEKLESLNGNLVRVPGFMIPLEDSERAVSEFLLVPYPLACIHVPAPPPNQIVHVKMEKGKRAAMDWYEPIWVQGRFEIKTVKNVYTEASYFMTGLFVEPYKYR
jgi:hypothetical protein